MYPVLLVFFTMYKCDNNVSLWVLNVLKPGIAAKQFNYILSGINELLIGLYFKLNNLLNDTWLGTTMKQHLLQANLRSNGNAIYIPI